VGKLSTKLHTWIRIPLHPACSCYSSQELSIFCWKSVKLSLCIVLSEAISAAYISDTNSTASQVLEAMTWILLEFLNGSS
jgi:hypothetical protein